MTSTWRPAAVLLGSAGAVLVLTGASLALGSVPVGITDILRTLQGLEPKAAAAGPILSLVRVPRTITAAGAGAALGLAGLAMQTVFRNALAGPGVLGVTSGAGLGVAMVLLAGVGTAVPGITAIAAMTGAAVVLGLALAVNRIVGQPVFLLVLGLLFGYAASSLTTLLMASTPSQGLERYVVWSFGSFALPPGPVPWVMLAGAAATAGILSLAGPRIDALLLGPAYAESSGIHARRSQGLLILVAGALTGLVTAFTGPITFLGVAVPHIARGAVHSSRHRALSPATALIGAGLALLADLVARLPGSDRALPLNAVTALIGVPVVILVILRGRPAGDDGGMGL